RPVTEAGKDQRNVGGANAQFLMQATLHAAHESLAGIRVAAAAIRQYARPRLLVQSSPSEKKLIFVVQHITGETQVQRSVRVMHGRLLRYPPGVPLLIDQNHFLHCRRPLTHLDRVEVRRKTRVDARYAPDL